VYDGDEEENYRDEPALTTRFRIRMIAGAVAHDGATRITPTEQLNHCIRKVTMEL
jgi:hypothetical protein